MNLTIIWDQPEPTHLDFSFEQLQQVDSELQVPDVSIHFQGRVGSGLLFREFLTAVVPHADSIGELLLQSSFDQFEKRIDWNLIPTDSVLIYAVEGKPLPQDIGGPFRLLVPGTKVCGTAVLDNCVNVKHLDRVTLLFGKVAADSPE